MEMASSPVFSLSLTSLSSPCLSLRFSLILVNISHRSEIGFSLRRSLFVGNWRLAGILSTLSPPLPPSLLPSALFGAALHRRCDADNMMPPFIFPRLSLSLNPLLDHWSYLPVLVGALGSVMGGGEEGREREGRRNKREVPEGSEAKKEG